MHKLRRCVVSDDPAKKARLLHGCNLALLGLMLCTTLSAGTPPQVSGQDIVKGIELLSYEGQKVSSVELAGQPDLNLNGMLPLLSQQGGQDFSVEKINETIAALRNTGQFKDVELDLRPEPDGVRVVFILQPAFYFGMYRFPGAERFSYNRLIVASGYVPQEPYSELDIRRAHNSLLVFLRRNGYFEAEVTNDIQIDRTNALVNVNFNVKLNRRADFGDIIIEEAPPDQAEHLKKSLRSLRAWLKMSAVREGKDYSFRTLQNATQFIESHLQSDDYLAAMVRLTGANYDPQTNRADVIFNVQPGPPVHAEIEGAHLWPWTRRKLLPIYQQNGLTPELIQEGRHNLLRRFRQKGYFDVQVDVETNARPDGIIVTYRVKKGVQKRIEDVAFEGNAHFSEDVLEKHVKVSKAGFLSNGSYDENSVRTLEGFYQSKGFNEVRVVPRFDTEDGHVIVTFVVNEGPRDTVETLRVRGNNTVSLAELAPRGLRTTPNQPYSQSSIDDDRNKIMSHYLENGYLTASFRADAEPLSADPHRFEVIYDIQEGPQVRTSNIVTIGNSITRPGLIERQTRAIKSGRLMTEREIFASEGRLYATGVFDWAEVSPRRQITTQGLEDVIVKLHESKRNAISYGLGYEIVNKGGTIPRGTVVFPGIPGVEFPDTFIVNQRRVQGPRASLLYTRTNLRGRGQTFTAGGIFGPLDRRATLSWDDPNFRWTEWMANLTATAESIRSNPLFNGQNGQIGFQLQRPINAKATRWAYLRYTFTRVNLTDLVIPELVPVEDRRERLSTFSGVLTHDTRDSALDPHTGIYESIEVNLNPSALGSSVNFGRLLSQLAIYRQFKKVVWANSLRIGLVQASSGSHVPISQKFFSGGGSTLRGLPLNGAGPQKVVTVCSNTADPSTCSLVHVPTGGPQLVILNSELRVPFPVRKGLTFAAFYDGGNVFESIGFSNFFPQYTNSVGVGLRYATVVGPVRVDVGRNLNPIPGIRATQVFVTVGQAF